MRLRQADEEDDSGVNENNDDNGGGGGSGGGGGGGGGSGGGGGGGGRSGGGRSGGGRSGGAVAKTGKLATGAAKPCRCSLRVQTNKAIRLSLEEVPSREGEALYRPMWEVELAMMRATPVSAAASTSAVRTHDYDGHPAWVITTDAQTAFCRWVSGPTA